MAAAESASGMQQEDLSDLVRDFVRPLKKSKYSREEALVRIKRCVKNGADVAAREAEYYIARELEQPAASVKLCCLHVLDVLFQRSKAFRQAVAADCRHVFSCLLVEMSKSLRVKGSDEEIAQLRHRSLQLLTQWDAQHGMHLSELHALRRYLSEVHGLQLDTAQIERERVAEFDRLLIARTRRVLTELEETSAAIDENLSEIDGALNLLFPRMVETMTETEEEAVSAGQPAVTADTRQQGNAIDEQDTKEVDEDKDNEGNDDDDDEGIAWESADDMDYAKAESSYLQRQGPPHSSEGYSIQDTMAILGIHSMNFALTINLGQPERLQDEGSDDLLNHLKDCLRALRQHHIQRVASWKTTLAKYAETFIDSGRSDTDRTLRIPVQRWQRWVQDVTSRVSDVQRRCREIDHHRQRKSRKRAAAVEAQGTEGSSEAQRARFSQGVALHAC